MAIIQKHKLQIIILRQMARTGQLLERARHEMPHLYQVVLQAYGITSSDADAYIAVFHNINNIKLAEQWDSNELGQLSSPKEALKVLRNLHNKRH
jgi:hypothetical protein